MIRQGLIRFARHMVTDSTLQGVRSEYSLYNKMREGGPQFCRQGWEVFVDDGISHQLMDTTITLLSDNVTLRETALKQGAVLEEEDTIDFGKGEE